jgi:diamine N-acetyltransferase
LSLAVESSEELSNEVTALVTAGGGTGIALRPLTVYDLPAVWAWAHDPEIVRLFGEKFGAADDPERWWRTLGPSYGRLGFAIEWQGQLIGDVELEHISWRSGEAEVRICIGRRELWGRGHGTRALEELRRYAFEHLGLSRLYLRVWDYNRRAIRSYEKAGFRKRARLDGTGRLAGLPPLWLMETEAGAAG